MAVWPWEAVETEVRDACTAFTDAVAVRAPIQPFRRSMAGSLTLADGTRQTQLLYNPTSEAPDNHDPDSPSGAGYKQSVFNACLQQMDGLAGIGCDMVTVGVGFPLLDPARSRSEDYEAFYRDLVIAAHKRDLHIGVEAAFPQNNPSIGVTFPWGNYSKAQLLAGNVEHCTTLWNLGFDDVVGMNEPSSMNATVAAYLTPVEYFTPTDFATMAADTMAQLDGFREDGRRYGLGAGSWEHPLWWQTFLTARYGNKRITLLDGHAYSVYRLGALAAMAEGAYRAGVAFGVGEMGAQLQGANEAGSPGTSGPIFLRGAYENATDTHITFLDAMVAMAERYRARYLSYFFVHDFFATLPYTDTTAAYTYAQAMNALDVAAFPNYATNTWSPLGQHWHDLCVAAALTRPRTAHTGRTAATTRTADAARTAW
jgi:hypothetical protein